MKSECREYLQDYILKCCQEADIYDFYTAFKCFSAFEIESKEDIQPAIDDFFAFLEESNQFICKSGFKNPPKLIKYPLAAVHRFFETPLTNKHIAFAEMVKTFAPRKHRTRILEVGAGMYPKTSIYMAETHNYISAMDSNFILSSKSMKGMNVDAFQQFFDVNTQIQQYDFIVGRQPCFAIESMVKLCSQQDKPYFIELCDCALPKDEYGKRDISLWMDILKGIDSQINFYENQFVYNLDVSRRQFNLTAIRNNCIQKPKGNKAGKELYLTELFG